MVRVKYKSTPYLACSPEHDEKDVNDFGFVDVTNLLNKRLVLSVKMDGGNTSLYSDRVASRNGDQALDYSYALLKQQHSYIKHLIPEHLIIYGEWLYHKHSINYANLESYFQMFSILDINTTMFYSWEEMLNFSQPLGMELGNVVPVVTKDGNILYTNKEQIEVPQEYIFEFDTALQFQKTVSTIGYAVINAGHEGLVIRNYDEFGFDDFDKNIAKFVRKGHVQSDEHWAKSARVKNQLRD